MAPLGFHDRLTGFPDRLTGFHDRLTGFHDRLAPSGSDQRVVKTVDRSVCCTPSGRFKGGSTMVVAVPFRILAAGALLAAGLAGCAGSGTPPEAAAAARTFAASWSAGKPGPSVDSRTAKGAAALMADATASLRVRRTQVRANGKVVCPRDKESRKVNAGRDVCHQQLSVEQDLAGLGAWTYSTTAQLRENEQGRWKVWWTPATFYPKLTSGTRLTRHRELPPRASILDKDGRPLTENGPVVRVGVEPRKVDPGG